MTGYKIPINRVCFNCGLGKTYINKRGLAVWAKHDNNYYCTKCEAKLFVNPKWSPIHHANRLTFKDKRPYTKAPPRKGVCEWCHKKIGDPYIAWRGKTKILNVTVMHHVQYHPEDPLKDTIELCQSCHKAEHWRLKKLIT